jgi:hypothetical protein
MLDRFLPGTVWPISLLLAGVLIEAGLLRIGVDDLDEGYFVQQAARVLHGQVPFRDFQTLYSPGLVYVHAALFWLTGQPSLVAERAVSLVARAGFVVGLYAIARPLVRNAWWAAAPGVLLLFGLDDAPVRWEPHPGWLSTLFAVVAVWCLLCGRSKRRLITAGALAALAYAFKQNTGIFILLAMLLWTRRHWPLVAFVVVTAVWLVPFALIVGDPTALAPLVGAVSGAGLFSPPEATILIPLAAATGGVVLIRRDCDPRLRWLVFAGTALFLTEFPRMDTLHLAWSAPLLLVLGAVALDRAPFAVGAVALAVCVLLLVPTLAPRVTYLAQPFARVADVQAPVATASDLERVVADIQSRTERGEPVFVYPTSPLLYVLADRPNPTRFDHLNPGAASSAQIQQVIADLQRSNVRVVVVSDFWRSAWGPPGDNALLEDFLSAHFADVIAQDGPYRVAIADL